MADFNRKKLQVFVSSTYEDLKDVRPAAVEAILSAGHIPAGMELFTAGDESQMEVIKQWIDESDVYLLILGGRYGSIEPTTGKSYTQLEYEYAASNGKPLFACVAKESAIEARVRAEGTRMIERDNPQKLNEFRGAVLTKMSKFWEDTKDIKITVSETLSNFARREDLVGWVRATSQSDLPAIADEIARLSKENARLRNQLLGTTQEDRINGLTFHELKAVLEKHGSTRWLIENSRQLSALHGFQPRWDPNRSDIEELMVRGLVEGQYGGFLRITEAGRAFLNKYAALELRSIPKDTIEQGAQTPG